MPAQPTKDKLQLATQIDADILTRFRAYAKARGETITAAIERAMRREMAFPPPAEPLAPLPDGRAGKPTAKGKGGAK